MKILKITTVLIFAAALAGCGNITQGKAAAERAVAHFHSLYNQGKLEAIWKEADPKFHSTLTEQKFDDFMGPYSASWARLLRLPTADGGCRPLT